MNLVKQEYIVTSPANEKLMLAALKSQVSSQIFRDLINGEKAGLKVTFLVETIEEVGDIVPA